MKRYLTLIAFTILISACEREDNDSLNTDSLSKIAHKTLNITVESLQYNNPILLDLNNDGKVDYNLSSVLVEENDKPYLYLLVRGDSHSNNQVMVKTEPELILAAYWANPLNKDIEINNTPVADCKWNEQLTKGFFIGVMDDGVNKVYSGEWIGKQDKYLGLRFAIDGKYHYGWIRVSHTAGQDKLMIADYAYNKEADKSIKSGQK
jgi:hypothetical protein